MLVDFSGRGIYLTMEQFDVECLVVGAGVVGLAVARALAKQGKEVVLVEQTESIGNGISSRNSEVIHAGIYYPKAALKQNCVLKEKHFFINTVQSILSRIKNLAK